MELKEYQVRTLSEVKTYFKLLADWARKSRAKSGIRNRFSGQGMGEGGNSPELQVPQKRHWRAITEFLPQNTNRRGQNLSCSQDD